MGKKRPVLVTGSHRSGTTWIGQTISRHPGVIYVREPFNADHPNPITGLKLNTVFAHYPSSNQKEEIKTSFDDLLQPNSLKYAMKICKASGMDIKTLLRLGKHLLVKSLRGSRILVKDPIALLSAGWLYETYDFKVIVMIRNPFAFVGSLKTAGWTFCFENLRKQEGLMQGWLNQFADRIESMCMEENEDDFIGRSALLWNILHFVILEYQKRYPEWLFVKHEDVAMNPEPEFHKIFDYLELDFNNRILKYIRNYTSQRNPKEAASNDYQPRDSRSSLNTWKERLSNDEIERVKVATRDIASHFYEKIIESGR